MLALLRILAFPIASMVLLILGSGLFSTFISLRLELSGETQGMIGLVASAYYGGVLAGSLCTPLWINRFGHVRTLIAFCALNSLLMLIPSLWIDPIFWAFIRFLGGISMGTLFIVIESWFLIISDPAARGRSLSIYLLIFYAALSIGQQLINLADPYSFIPYCVASTFSALAILPILIGTCPMPSYGKSQRFTLFEVFRASPFGFFGGIISGMLLASIYGLAPVYGQETGLSISEISTLMSIIIFGGLSLQWPFGKWADLSGRKKVLVFACFSAAVFSLLIAYSDGASWGAKLILLWLFGGFSFVLYPLSMACTCEKVPECQLVAATGGFSLAYGMGAITGPLLAPFFMDWTGASGLFYFTGSLCSAMGLIGFLPSLARFSPKP